MNLAGVQRELDEHQLNAATGRVRLDAVTVVFVAFATRSLDTSWLVPGDSVVVVHNDSLLEPDAVTWKPTRHLYPRANLGFGAAVNLALNAVTTRRLILCNPDTRLRPVHRMALAADDADVICTIPLLDEGGRPTHTASPYPTPSTAAAIGYRLGRLAPRGSRLRAVTCRLLHLSEVSTATGTSSCGSWPLTSYWASGAVMSIDTERLRSAGGFDTGFFLYMEDVDLCHRLAELHPTMRVRMAACPPGTHLVGGSTSRELVPVVELIRLRSLRRYCCQRRGWGWRFTHRLTGPREWWLELRVRRSLHGAALR